MNKLNNNKTFIIGGVTAIIFWIIIAIITFNRTFVPLQKYISINSNIILHISLVNHDITKTGSLMRRLIFCETYKPAHYKRDIKKYTKKLSLNINRTDKDYKSLFILLSIKQSVKLKKVSFSNSKYFSTYVKKSYYHWEFISKPIVKRFIKYVGFVPLKLSDKMFLEYTLNRSILPTYSFIQRISAGFAYLIRFAAFTFVFGTILIIFLVILVIYYLNKFFGEIRKSEQRFRTMFDNSPVVHILMDIQTGNIVDVNKAAEKFYGYTKAEFKSINITNIALSSVEDHKKFRLEVYGRGFNNSTVRIINHKLKNNEVRRVELAIAPIELDGKEYLIDSITDITEKINYENSLRKSVEFFKVLSENIPSIIGLYREKVIYINPFGLKALGYNENEAKELSPLELVEGREDEKLILSENIKRRLAGEPFQEKYTLKVKMKDGETFWGDILATTIFYENKWTGLIIITDVSERVAKELKLLKEKDALKELSEIDALTGIPNRRSFDEKLKNYLNGAVLKNIKFSLIMFDIDHFKGINDTLGHQAGDTVLSELAFLVKESIRKEDFLARFGGEEFMIILNNARLESAVELAEKLRLNIESRSLSVKSVVRCSFGVTAYRFGDTSESIIKRVDDALYEAKEQGRNRVKSI